MYFVSPCFVPRWRSTPSWKQFKATSAVSTQRYHCSSMRMHTTPPARPRLPLRSTSTTTPLFARRTSTPSAIILKKTRTRFKCHLFLSHLPCNQLHSSLHKYSRDPVSNYFMSQVAASKFDLNYIQLDGSIGCLVNGAGLAMVLHLSSHKYNRDPVIISFERARH